MKKKTNGGEGGIRTLGKVTPTHAFQACSLNHSDTSPKQTQSGRSQRNVNYMRTDFKSQVLLISILWESYKGNLRKPCRQGVAEARKAKFIGINERIRVRRNAVYGVSGGCHACY